MKMHRTHAQTLLVALMMMAATMIVAGEPVTDMKASRQLQPDDLWTAISSSGSVESRTPGQTVLEWGRLKRGDHLPPLSMVRTDVRGRTTLTRRGDIIIVSPDTEVVLPVGDITSDSIRQNSGKALYKVEPGHKGRRFEVVTPYLVAGVKGTQFSVHVEKDRVAVDVVEGHVEVLSLLNGKRVDLFEGHMVMMERDGTFDLFQQDRENEAGEKPARMVTDIRKETRSMAREAVASMEVSDFMGELKGMLSDSHADYRNSDALSEKTRAMAEKLGVDLEKLKEMMEEQKNHRSDDKEHAVVKPPRGTTPTKPANPGSGN